MEIFISIIIVGLFATVPHLLKEHTKTKRLQRLLLKKKTDQEKETRSLLGILAQYLQRKAQQYLPEKRIQELKQTIVVSHIENYTITRHYLLMLLCALFSGMACWTVFWGLNKETNPIVIAGVGILGLFVPGISLKQAIHKNHRQVLQELPQFINLLRVCIEAGLDLESAFKKLI